MLFAPLFVSKGVSPQMNRHLLHTALGLALFAAATPCGHAAKARDTAISREQLVQTMKTESRWFTSKRPLIVAHRGASGFAPENTLVAFKLARELKADGIELDARLTKDGVAVCMHDSNIDRTSNGKGLVSALTWDEMKNFDAGSWKDPRYKGEPIARLDKVFEECSDLLLDIEMKLDQGTPPEPLAKAICDMVRKSKTERTVLITSFSADCLAAVNRYAPEIPTALIYYGETPATIAPEIDGLVPHSATVNEDYMKWTRERKFPVYVWTVDAEAEMRRLLDLNVAGIITNVPNITYRLLNP